MEIGSKINGILSKKIWAFHRKSDRFYLTNTLLDVRLFVESVYGDDIYNLTDILPLNITENEYREKISY